MLVMQMKMNITGSFQQIFDRLETSLELFGPELLGKFSVCFNFSLFFIGVAWKFFSYVRNWLGQSSENFSSSKATESFEISCKILKHLRP